jgi:hypothetical protein
LSALMDNLVDDFVSAVNAAPREPVALSTSPPSVYAGSVDETGFRDWRIKAYSAVDWVDPLESCLHRNLPALYRSLVTRYIFPAFEIGDTLFFANTPEGTDFHELRTRIFSDEHMANFLLPRGFVQFGVWQGYKQYDAVCFDTNRSVGSDDHPIVQIDHEAILCHDTLNIITDLAASFEEMITLAVHTATGGSE